MKALRTFTLALAMTLSPVLVCSAYAQGDGDPTEQPSTPEKKDKKAAKKKKKVAKKFPFKMEKKGFERIINRAKEANVPVMVLFTNPPTCPYCVKLEQEVLSKPQWKKGVAGRILCIYIDFACKDPMAKELSSKLPHNGIPSYYFINPHNFQPLGKGGYMTDRPIKDYVSGVDAACKAMEQYVQENSKEDGDDADGE